MNAGITPSNTREHLRSRALQFAPFWFHQGIDLNVFNILSEAARQAFAHLQQNGSPQQPESLDEWERYARMWVLIYGAYFEALGAPGEKYVGVALTFSQFLGLSRQSENCAKA
jgi:hypothetical protein